MAVLSLKTNLAVCEAQQVPVNYFALFLPSLSKKSKKLLSSLLKFYMLVFAY